MVNTLLTLGESTIQWIGRLAIVRTWSRRPGRYCHIKSSGVSETWSVPWTSTAWSDGNGVKTILLTPGNVRLDHSYSDSSDHPIQGLEPLILITMSCSCSSCDRNHVVFVSIVDQSSRRIRLFQSHPVRVQVVPVITTCSCPGWTKNDIVFVRVL